MAYFPFYYNIENKKCVIIGGGKIAQGKAEKLLSFKPLITVVAPEISKNLLKLNGIEFINDIFIEKYIKNADFVIAATNNNDVNNQIFKYCIENKIPINTVDDPEKCTFIFPSIINKGDLSISICSGGKSPFITKYLRKQAEKLIPDYIDDVINQMTIIREHIKILDISPTIKNEIYESVLTGLINAKGNLTENELNEIIMECLK